MWLGNHSAPTKVNSELRFPALTYLTPERIHSIVQLVIYSATFVKSLIFRPLSVSTMGRGEEKKASRMIKHQIRRPFWRSTIPATVAVGPEKRNDDMKDNFSPLKLSKTRPTRKNREIQTRNWIILFSIFLHSLFFAISEQQAPSTVMSSRES